VLATKGLVLGKLERHHGTKIKTLVKWLLVQKMIQHQGLEIHPKMGMDPRVKCVDGPMRKLKNESFLFELHHL
jgi:hypothetical protein